MNKSYRVFYRHEKTPRDNQVIWTDVSAHTFQRIESPNGERLVFYNFEKQEIAFYNSGEITGCVEKTHLTRTQQLKNYTRDRY